MNVKKCLSAIKMWKRRGKYEGKWTRSGWAWQVQEVRKGLILPFLIFKFMVRFINSYKH